MRLIDKQDLELIVAAMVVAELGAARFEPRDVQGAPDSTRDFDIVFPDGREEPLEVTTNLDTTTMSALQRTDGGIVELDAAVTRLWMGSGNQTFTNAKGTTVPFDRRRVSEILPPLIEQLEREGETSLDVAHLRGRALTALPRTTR
jgi:hypothetical protein